MGLAYLAKVFVHCENTCWQWHVKKHEAQINNLSNVKNVACCPMLKHKTKRPQPLIKLDSKTDAGVSTSWIYWCICSMQMTKVMSMYTHTFTQIHKYTHTIHAQTHKHICDSMRWPYKLYIIQCVYECGHVRQAASQPHFWITPSRWAKHATAGRDDRQGGPQRERQLTVLTVLRLSRERSSWSQLVTISNSLQQAQDRREQKHKIHRMVGLVFYPLRMRSLCTSTCLYISLSIDL